MNKQSFSNQLSDLLAQVPLESPTRSGLGTALDELARERRLREASGPPAWLALAAGIAMFALVFALRPGTPEPVSADGWAQQRALIDRSQALESWLRANGRSDHASAGIESMLQNIDALLAATDARDPASLVLWETRVALLSAQARQQSDSILVSAVQDAWSPDLL